MTVIADEIDRFRRKVEDSKKDSLSARIRAGLEERGLQPLPSNYRPPEQFLCSPNCPNCHGTGYIRKDPGASVTDPLFGRLKICPNYSIRQLKDRARSGDWDLRVGIEASDLELHWDLVKKDLSDGIKAVGPVRSALEAGHGAILLRGNYGQAKTLIGKIMVATALLAGKRAAYANMSRILDDIRLAFDSQEAKTTELLRRMDWWFGLDVLFVDEIDRVNGTDWAQERMFQLIDHRYQRAVREEALTVMASNAAVKALDGYLQSRLKDNRLGPIIELNGTDARLVMPKGVKS